VTKEAKVRVRLDTSGAKSDLRQLTHEAGTASRAIGGSVSGPIGAGVRAIGAGIASMAGGAIGSFVGGSLASIQSNATGGLIGPTLGGIGDYVGQVGGLLGNRLSHWLLGDAAANVRAENRAQEDIIRIFGRAAGRSNAIPSGAHRMFQHYVENIYGPQERGADLIRRSGEFAPTAQALIDDIAANWREHVWNAIKWSLKNTTGLAGQLLF
jgi:hypothetical protein